MRFSTALLFVSALLPFAAATYPTGQSNCGNDQFKWGNDCLPKGGPPQSTTTKPPNGSDCPPTNYYWGSKQGCCVPKNPPPTTNYPEPQCRKNWTWYPALRKCLPTPTPPSPPPSTPSKYNGNNGNNGNNGYNHYKKRTHKSRSTLCPTGLDACPIKGLTASDYECLDTYTELESCGGCTSVDKGQDCTSIEGAWNVGCEQARCVVYTCAAGFQLGLDRKTCISL